MKKRLIIKVYEDDTKDIVSLSKLNIEADDEDSYDFFEAKLAELLNSDEFQKKMQKNYRISKVMYELKKLNDKYKEEN